MSFNKNRIEVLLVNIVNAFFCFVLFQSCNVKLVVATNCCYSLVGVMKNLVCYFDNQGKNNTIILILIFKVKFDIFS